MSNSGDHGSWDHQPGDAQGQRPPDAWAQAPAEPQDPYGQPVGTFGRPQAQDPFPQPHTDPFGQQPDPYRHHAPPPAPDRSSIQTNAIILIVVGVLCGGMVPMVFGIIALTQLDSDPESARRMNKIGWIVFAAIIGFSVLMLVLSFVLVPVFFGVALLPLLFGL